MQTNSTGVRAAKTLSNCGVASGPIFLLIFIIQTLIHPEFHFTLSEPSLLSIGALGWIQIANFVIGGLLVIAGSLGMRGVRQKRSGVAKISLHKFKPCVPHTFPLPAIVQFSQF